MKRLFFLNLESITQKIFLLFAIFCISATGAFAQDVIILKNGNDIKAVVSEIGTDEVKYKRFDNTDGPTYTLKKGEIFMIMYPNGSRDVFSDVSTPAPVETNNRLPQISITKEPTTYSYNKFRLYLSLVSGHSCGGLWGPSLEARFNRFGFHTGVGVLLTDNNDYLDKSDHITWSIGGKWYFWKDMYTGTMIGVIGQEHSYEYDRYGRLRYSSESIVGLSEMIGYRWSWGSSVRFGVNAGLGFAYGFNYDLFTIAYDVGVSVSFGTK